MGEFLGCPENAPHAPQEGLVSQPGRIHEDSAVTASLFLLKDML
jgi:hypothetical protein